MSEQITLSPYTENDIIWNDVSKLEAWREYHFANGGTYRIEHPIKVNVKRGDLGDSHRVIDAKGIRHYIPVGWIAFRFSGEFGIGSPADKPREEDYTF